MANNNKKFYDLRLYIIGKTGKSESALKTSKYICGTHFQSNCHLEIIDLLERPEMGAEDQILATPILVRKHPTPELRIMGDLTEMQKVIDYLEIKSEE